MMSACLRRFLLVCGLVAILAACGGGSDPQPETASGEQAADVEATTAVETETVPAIPTAAPSDLSGESPQADATVESDGVGSDAAEPASEQELDMPPVDTPADSAVPPSDSGLGADFDAAIDRLVVDCIDGMDIACDVLLGFDVGDGAPQRQVAATCGGRGAPDDGFCLEGVDRESTFSPAFQDDSAAIATLGQACSDGDMTACDFLYYRSGFDSQWRAIGDTCAGRVETAVPTCRDTLG